MTDEKKPGNKTLHLSSGTLRGGSATLRGGAASRGPASPTVTVQIKRKRPTIGIPQDKAPLTPPKPEETPSSEKEIRKFYKKPSNLKRLEDDLVEKLILDYLEQFANVKEVEVQTKEIRGKDNANR